MLIGAVLVLGAAVVIVGTLTYGLLAPPVLYAPVDGAGVPTALLNGADLPSLPSVVADAFDRPVVQVGAVEDPLRELSKCRGLAEWEFAPTLRASVITPEGLTVSIRGEEAGTEGLLQVTCFASWGGRSWQTWASWVVEAADLSEALGPPQRICCREDGLAMGGGEVVAPEEARWLVQDRGAYLLAYPVDDGGLVHPVWPVEGDSSTPPPSVFLDALGRELPMGGAPPAGGQEGQPPDEGQQPEDAPPPE